MYIFVCLEQIKQTIVVNVEPQYTIIQIKQLIKNSKYCKPEHQMIIFNCIVLEDDDTLYHCGVINGSLLTMTLTGSYAIFLQITTTQKLYQVIVDDYDTLNDVADKLYYLEKGTFDIRWYNMFNVTYKAKKVDWKDALCQHNILICDTLQLHIR